jgi:hypothetical protein
MLNLKHNGRFLTRLIGKRESKNEECEIRNNGILSSMKKVSKSEECESRNNGIFSFLLAF